MDQRKPIIIRQVRPIKASSTDIQRFENKKKNPVVEKIQIFLLIENMFLYSKRPLSDDDKAC